MDLPEFRLTDHLGLDVPLRPRKGTVLLLDEALAVAEDSVLPTWAEGADVPAPDISLKQFVKEAWPILEPGRKFLDNWHIDNICEHLEAVSRNEIQRLVINIPPRHMKSLTVAVLWQPWEWTWLPWTQWIFTAHKDTLSKRDTMKSRRLIQSQWYQQRWGHLFKLTTDQNEKMRYENSRTGIRIATSIGAGATGEGGDRIIFDDPHSARQIHSDAKREAVIDNYREEMSTRANDPERSAYVLIMQRLHDQDLAGYVLDEGNWEHLCFPGEFELPMLVRGHMLKPSQRNWTETSLGGPEMDPRTKPGALLWPERFGPKHMEQLRKDLGAWAYAGQIQQRPAPSEGGIFKRAKWVFWHPQGMDLPAVTIRMPDGEHHVIPSVRLPLRFDFELQSWDMAFKGLAESAYVVGQSWASRGIRSYLLDQVRRKMDFTESIAQIKEFRKMHPNGAVLIEDKANGPAAQSALRDKIAGIIMVGVDQDKVGRAWAEQPYQEAGEIVLPHPAIAPWVWDFIEEAATFPNSSYKDQIDTFTQANNFMRMQRKVRVHAGPYDRVQQ